jgi:hypothetical protein
MRLMPRDPFCQIATDQDRQAGAGQRPEKRRQRRAHFEEAEADDDDRNHRCHGREHGEPPRPGSERGNRLGVIWRGKPAGHRLGQSVLKKRAV